MSKNLSIPLLAVQNIPKEHINTEKKEIIVCISVYICPTLPLSLGPDCSHAKGAQLRHGIWRRRMSRIKRIPGRQMSQPSRYRQRQRCLVPVIFVYSGRFLLTEGRGRCKVPIFSQGIGFTGRDRRLMSVPDGGGWLIEKLIVEGKRTRLWPRAKHTVKTIRAP
jgi:hypothetical protein